MNAPQPFIWETSSEADHLITITGRLWPELILAALNRLHQQQEIWGPDSTEAKKAAQALAAVRNSTLVQGGAR
jgi:hypothetical protein